MTAPSPPPSVTPARDNGRRGSVLASALETFARYGYQKTSMEDVARAAGISRPGLYLLFGSKQELFTTAVTHALDQGLTAAAAVLADTARPLRERLLDAFDQWTGRYIGAMSSEANAMAEEYKDLLGSAATEYPRQFAELLNATLAEPTAPTTPNRSAAATQTLISVSIGIKHQVTTRDAFLERLATAIDLIVG